jgi:hypothetical protein
MYICFTSDATQSHEHRLFGARSCTVRFSVAKGGIATRVMRRALEAQYSSFGSSRDLQDGFIKPRDMITEYKVWW